MQNHGFNEAEAVTPVTGLTIRTVTIFTNAIQERFVSVATIQCDPTSSTDQETSRTRAPTENIDIRIAFSLVRNASAPARVRIVWGAEFEPELWR